MEGTLLLEMIERISLAATLAFVLSRTKPMSRMHCSCMSRFDRVKLSAAFGAIGILGTYAGIPVGGALANSRVVGVMAAGLIGGPAMGLAAGAIAGTHRYLLGGFTAFSCALANICEGLLAGVIAKYCALRPIPWQIALFGGALGETMQMGIILLTARPFAEALSLVGQIALPMIVANSIGLAVFMLIVKTTTELKARAGALQAQKSLLVAAKTLPHFRRGLDEQSAAAAARIVYEQCGYHAVAIADTERTLAFVGAANSLRTGRVDENRPQNSAVSAPLNCGEATIGSLQLYRAPECRPDRADAALAAGLAELFSIQLELAETDRRAKQAARAELKALQAQVNPHFLFNTLNTIASLIRTNPALARDLLLKLSGIFRFVLRQTGKDITLCEELAQARAYLAIEKARYGDKLRVVERIELNPDIYLIPSMTVQPLIENAVRHGLKPKPKGGTVTIEIKAEDERVEIKISDDGVGMNLRQDDPLQTRVEGHIGVRNVHERLRGQYGEAYGLRIESAAGEGTAVTIVIPKRIAMEGAYAESFDCGR